MAANSFLQKILRVAGFGNPRARTRRSRELQAPTMLVETLESRFTPSPAVETVPPVSIDFSSSGIDIAINEPWPDTNKPPPILNPTTPPTMANPPPPPAFSTPPDVTVTFTGPSLAGGSGGE